MVKPAPNPEKQECHERRHMKPAQYMVYDAMRAMGEAGREKNGGKCICYAKLPTIMNRVSIGRTQVRENIVALVAIHWLVPLDKVRWRNGQWANSRFEVLTHDEYIKLPTYLRKFCPSIKYDDKGNRIGADKKTKDSAGNMVLRKWRKENEWLSLLGKTLAELTPEQRQECFDVIADPDYAGPQTPSPAELRAMKEKAASIRRLMKKNRD